MTISNTNLLLSTFLLAATACPGEGGTGTDDPTGSTGPSTDATTDVTGSDATTPATSSMSSDPTTETGDPGTSSGDDTADDDTGAPAGPVASCQEACASADDCLPGYECGPAGHCTTPSCNGDDDRCAALLGGWTHEGCTSSDECDGTTCIEFAGTTFCAPAFGGGGCFEATSTDVTAVEGNTVTVCVAPARCGTDGLCFSGCFSDGNCLGFAHPTCSDTTGRCECTADSCAPGQACVDGTCRCTGDEGCSPFNGGSVCVDGTCECTGDDDCPPVPGFETCHDGVCSCGSDEACSGLDVHPGEPVCAPV